MNLSTAQDGYSWSVVIPLWGDKFNDVWVEYSNMLQNQHAKRNNGLTKTKFLTFGIEADSFRIAKPRLERIKAKGCGFCGRFLGPDIDWNAPRRAWGLRRGPAVRPRPPSAAPCPLGRGR